LAKSSLQDGERVSVQQPGEGTNGKGRSIAEEEDLPVEPWRIKVVERMHRPSREERERLIRENDFCIFRIPSSKIFIDLLTDSGTSAMSDEQWAGLMTGDESYAGSRNFFRLEETVQRIFGFPEVIPTHQGRAAENMLYSALVDPGSVVPGSNHFDTSRAHIEVNGGQALDLASAEAKAITSSDPFKGNLDVGRLRGVLSEVAEKVPLVTMTLTNNMSGGQPASLQNIREVSQVCREFGKPFFIDACRFAENAYFIQQRETGEAGKSVEQIAREIFDLADGCTVSGKKDGLSNIGGFVACRDAQLAKNIKQRLILVEGFPTYGGLAGRDLEALARGLEEVVDEEYLRFRTGQVAYFGRCLQEQGVPVLTPFGGHAVYVDAGALLPHIPPTSFPGITVVTEVYREAGVRCAEFGTSMQARLDADGQPMVAPAELVRLCIPRRVYTNSHLSYVAKALGRIRERADSLRGYRIVEKDPGPLGHFSARYAELDA
jgi:tryptophanase